MGLKQRDLHFYWINELALLLFLYALLVNPSHPFIFPDWPYWARFIFLYLLVSLVVTTFTLGVCVIRRQFRPSAALIKSIGTKQLFPLPTWKTFDHVCRDGTVFQTFLIFLFSSILYFLWKVFSSFFFCFRFCLSVFLVFLFFWIISFFVHIFFCFLFWLFLIFFQEWNWV